MNTWEGAQQYEFNFWTRWLKGELPQSSFERVLKVWNEPRDLTKMLRLGKPTKFAFEELMNWKAFHESMRGKAACEIGCACVGWLPLWDTLGCSRRVLIDPLLTKYKQLLDSSGQKHWFTNDMEYYAEKGEKLLPQLVGKIDGALICMNVLDHCDDPLLTLKNFVAYAATGCTLFFDSCIQVPDGGDAWHKNVTTNEKDCFKIIEAAGFSTERGGGCGRKEGGGYVSCWYKGVKQ